MVKPTPSNEIINYTWPGCNEVKCGGICVCDSACMAEYLLCTENGEGGGVKGLLQ